MSSQAGPPPAGGNVDEDPRLLAVTWTWLSLSTIFVGLRFYVRYLLTGPPWWDDYVLLFSYCVDITMAVFRTMYAREGLARHVYYLSDEQIVHAYKYGWISLGVAIMAHSTGRISVALLMYRIQGKCRWRSIFLFTIIGLLICTAITGVCLAFFQCSPPDALWNSWKVDAGIAHCLSSDAVDYYFIGAASFWCSTDFMLAALPITIVWSLNLSVRKKVAVCCLTGMGVFAGVCAIFKVYYLRNLLISVDATWVDQPLFIWDTNEINVIIIAASIATLRPLWLWLTDRHGVGSEMRRQRAGIAPKGASAPSRRRRVPNIRRPALHPSKVLASTDLGLSIADNEPKLTATTTTTTTTNSNNPAHIESSTVPDYDLDEKGAPPYRIGSIGDSLAATADLGELREYVQYGRRDSECTAGGADDEPSIAGGRVRHEMSTEPLSPSASLELPTIRVDNADHMA